MVATTLSTAGLTGANCVIAAVFPVSGTGALTGVMKAFENATGKNLDEDKKELASEELITTGDLGDDIGQDKATGIINDVRSTRTMSVKSMRQCPMWTLRLNIWTAYSRPCH